MDSAQDKLKVILDSNDYSVTRQRLQVFDSLFSQEPMTIHQIVAKLHGTVDRASVYRTIDLFEKLGIAQRINIGWKYKIELSDKFSDHHHHLTCTICGKVIPINAEELEGFINRIAGSENFLAANHQIEIQGICSTCQ